MSEPQPDEMVQVARKAVIASLSDGKFRSLPEIQQDLVAAGIQGDLLRYLPRAIGDLQLVRRMREHMAEYRLANQAENPELWETLPTWVLDLWGVMRGSSKRHEVWGVLRQAFPGLPVDPPRDKKQAKRERTERRRRSRTADDIVWRASERAVIEAVRQERKSLADLESVMTDVLPEKRNSHVRNALRRPVAMGILRRVGKGLYEHRDAHEARESEKTEQRTQRLLQLATSPDTHP